MTILFINSAEKRCGVYQYGLRLYRSVKDHMPMDYVEVATLDEYRAAVAGRSRVIVNYYHSLFPYLNNSTQDEAIKFYYIYHESIFTDLREGLTLNVDPTHPEGIPRPIAYNDNTVYSTSDLNNPVIGTFGFGFQNKEFEKVVDLVQSQFDTATIRMQMPGAYWGDANSDQARWCGELCRSRVTKPGIRVHVTHDFMSDEDLFGFLSSNDLNIFLYPAYTGRSCSSVIDYALGVNRPLAISDSDMFRHIYSDAICAYKTPLRTIIANGPVVNAAFQAKWSPEVLASAIRARIGEEGSSEANIGGGSNA